MPWLDLAAALWVERRRLQFQLITDIRLRYAFQSMLAQNRQSLFSCVMLPLSRRVFLYPPCYLSGDIFPSGKTHMQSALVAEGGRLKTEHVTLTAERQSLRSQIPGSVVDSYDYVRQRTSGRPVAVLKGDVCSVCGMVVTMPIQQQVRRGLEAYCNNCRRLLVG